MTLGQRGGEAGGWSVVGLAPSSIRVLNYTIDGIFRVYAYSTVGTEIWGRGRQIFTEIPINNTPADYLIMSR